MCLKKYFTVFVVSFLFISQLGFSQVSTYGFGEAISTYTPLSTSTTAYTAPWDDHVSGSAYLAPLGFTFNYDGVNQTQCYISPNGFLSFGTQPVPTNYLPINVAGSFINGGTLSALGMDLISATDNIVFSTVGSAPNRVFVVQWTNARRKAITGNFNFQIRLLETTNVIEYSYGVCAPDDVTVFNAQLGIRGVTNSYLQGDIKNRWQTGINTNTTWFGKTVNGTSNGVTVRTSVTEYPNNGLRYTFTPSTPCVTPTGVPSGLVIGSSSVSTTSFVGNSFTTATPAPTNYLVLRSTVNVPPTNLNVANRVYWAVGNVISSTYTVVSVTNATTFTQTALTPNTTYYYWAIPYNSGCLGGPFYNLSSTITASNTTCIAAPTGVTASTVEGNSFTASWAAVAGATDYQVDVSTNTTFSALLPSYTNVSTGGATSLSVLGLNPLVTYYFRVRAVGISCNVYSATASVTTLCGAFSIPYYQNFDTTPVATVPSCFTITNDNLDSVAWQIQNSIAASTPNAFHLATNTSLDTNDWFFTPGLNLTAGVSYRLKFKYTTLSAGLYAENLRIRLGTGPSEVTMNITILNLPNLINTVYQTATVDFTPVTNDIFYLGFQGYSFASQSKIVVDDISIIVSPTCFEPANVTVTSVTSSSVAIAWEEPSPQPANGYQYYVSTTNTTPSDTVTPTGSVGFGATTATVTGLNAATLYYIWVRGNCSVTDSSVWSSIQSFSTDCSASSYLAVTNGALCGGGSTVLQATSNPGATVEWYAEATGDTLLATGNNFTTPTLFATTTYYAQSRAPGGLVVVGPTSPTLQGGALGVQQTQTFVSFSVATATTLQSFDIYPMVSGQSGVLVIRNSSNIAMGTYPYVTSVAGGSTAQTIAINLILPVGSYSLYMDTLPTSGLLVNIDSAAYPYTSSIATITGNGYDNTFYLYAYNWKFSNICRSLLTPVTATVTAAPPISFSTTASTLCNGETTELVTVTGASAYDTFTWSSSVGLSGTIATGFTFQPSVTTVYSLTASQSAGSLCTSVISYTVNVKPEPPGISILPPTATLCEGQVQPLNASLAASTPVTIYNETFNGVTNNWTTTNLSTGGLIANAAWTLRNSIYTYTSSYWNINMSSNDASRFYFSNSDSQGSPGTNRTLTYLISPSINLTGYTSASLSFWHYLRYIGGNKARVETSIDGGTTWTLLTSFILSKGTASGFVNAVVSMNSLVGNPDVKLRFLYDATWDYGWAIDNVKITGNLALEVSWLPATGLYFDAAATVPYIAGTPTALIYAKPTVTTTYTGSVVGANGCSASSTTVLTVLPAPVPGVLTGNQIICGNALPTAIVLTGYSGPIIRWEYASDAAFTVGLTTVFSTAATLSSGDIGTFSGDRYYRAVLQNGTCPVVYSNSVLISFPTTTWNGTAWSNGAPTASMKVVFNGNYSSLSSLNACSVEVVSGTVIINSGHTLTVQNDVKVVGGTFTFQNNSSLVQVNNLDSNGAPIVNTGNIIYKRTSTPVKKYDYTYWSSPVSPQTLANFSVGSTKFYTYDSTAGTWVTAVTNIPMVAGKGYIIRTPDIAPFNVTTANYFFGSFTGVPNTGTYNVPIIGGANQSNMLGNPYPSALSANSFLSDPANVPVIDGTIYLWTHNTPITANQYTANDYAVYNYVGGVGTSAVNIGLNNSVPNGKIASGQGFFVKGLSNGLVSYTNAMRLEGNNDQFFRMSTPTTTSVADLEAHRFWLDIYNSEGAFKQLLIGYIENATNGLDRGFDGQMVNGGNVISLYAMQDAMKLSIQGRALPFSTADVIPLGYKSTIASSYHISLSDFDGLFTTQTVYLEDALLNVVHNLSAGDYQFATDAGTFDTRFSLRFTNATLDVATPSFTANQVVIYKNTSNDFVITTGTTVMATVKVFDVRGRLLLEKKNINATETTVGGGMANEVLLIQITTVDGVVVTKRAIR